LQPALPIPFPYKRIVVIGVTGCGKSMLAGQLVGAEIWSEFHRIGCPVLETGLG